MTLLSPGFVRLILYAIAIPLGAYGLALHFLTRKRDDEVEEIDMADEWGDSKLS